MSSGTPGRPNAVIAEMIEVLPRYRPGPMSFSLLYAHRRNLPKRVRVFMDWVAEILWPVLAH